LACDASDIVALDVLPNVGSSALDALQHAGEDSVARLYALDAIHAAILDPTLLPWAEDCIQVWLHSGPVALRLGLLEEQRRPTSIEPLEALLEQINAKRRPEIASILVTTAKHFALCVIHKLDAGYWLQQSSLETLERQLQNSLNSISGVDEDANNLEVTRHLIEALPYGLLLIDTDGQPLLSNPEASMHLSSSGWAKLRKATAFNQALITAFASGKASFEGHVDGKRVSFKLQKIQYPKPRFTAHLTDVCLVQLESPDADLVAALNQLQWRFGLSRCEAETLGLCDSGRSVVQISEFRRVSVETVRAQLRACRKKTGTRSQLELIALVTNEKTQLAQVERTALSI